MTEQELEAIRQRCEAATPGPWIGDRNDGTIKYAMLGGKDGQAEVLKVDHKNGESGFYCGDEVPYEQCEANEEFVKHSRQDIPALLAEVKRLKNLCIIASQTMTVIDEWLGSASTRQAATDSMWRLNRVLEQNGFPYENKHILDWRGSILHELNDAGFYPNSPDAYGEHCRFVYDPSAPERKRIFGNAVGPTLKEVVADNAKMRAALLEINDLMITPWLVKDIIHTRAGDIIHKGGEG